MSEPLKFGKFKGKTMEEVAQTDEGINYLRWLKEQPCSDPKFKYAHDKQVKEIETVLNSIQNRTQEIVKSAQKKEGITESIKKEILLHLEMVKKLITGEIEEEEKGWDND